MKLKLLLLLGGPTIMILIGLQGLGSVPVTFVLFYGWLLAVPLWDMLARRRYSLSEMRRELGLQGSGKNIVYGVLTGGVFWGTIFLAGALFHPYLFERSLLQERLASWNFTGDHLIWLVLVLLVVNPCLEELYWRGYIFQQLRKRQSPGRVILMTSCFYSLYHFLSVIPLFAWPYGVFMVLPVFAAGLIWGYMRAKGTSIVGGVVSHILADAGIMSVYLVFLA
ncbi:CPBP family intramembrane glutamic endopeptidase [Brevibacillus composti]|uniref:CPBP family intramembrane glutamic endopeptidase n=1 Tax=Brevibacillus composti TaxID=2796470 RepID=UPI001E5C6371|nr:CPBP family intramembrane glutamic endopeptidase [Brevibacillus composti]